MSSPGFFVSIKKFKNTNMTTPYISLNLNLSTLITQISHLSLLSFICLFISSLLSTLTTHNFKPLTMFSSLNIVIETYAEWKGKILSAHVLVYLVFASHPCLLLFQCLIFGLLFVSFHLFFLLSLMTGYCFMMMTTTLIFKKVWFVKIVFSFYVYGFFVLTLLFVLRRQTILEM